MTDPTSAGVPGKGRTFVALRHPNFRLWFGGQLVSFFGTWMQITAQGFLVYELTGSSEYLGRVAFAAGMPAWIFMLWAGVVADRVPRRRMLIVTQLAMAAVAAALAAVTFAGVVRPWHVLALATAMGTATAFDAPARHAFVLELVGRDDLANAVALNSILFNIGLAVGPAAGGVLYAYVGPGWCFTVNALSYLVLIAALLRMDLPPHRPVVHPKSRRADLVEGLRYVARHREIRLIVATIAVVTVFAISMVPLLPAWAVKVLGGDATTNGFLQSARGAGAVLCALAVASLGRFRFKGRLLSVGTFALPLLLLVFSAIRLLPVSLVVLGAVGASMILVFILSNTLLQTLADDALRGRVMSVYSLTFFGFLPLGALGAGVLAERIGEPWTVAGGALVVLVFVVAVQIGSPGFRRLE